MKRLEFLPVKKYDDFLFMYHQIRTRNVAYISDEAQTLFMINFLKTKGIDDVRIAREARHLSIASYGMRKGMSIKLKKKIKSM